MKINAELLVRLRNERSWSQDELAISSGLNLRTIQRIEKEGMASLQSKKALAAAFKIDARDLDDEETIMNCPVCRSDELFQYKYVHPDGADFLPKLGGTFLSAKIRPTVCLTCGYVLFFASEEARKKARASSHWKAVGA